MYQPTANPAAMPRSCERCGTDVLRQRTGLPWVVTVDLERLTLEQAAARTTPNRSAWCLLESKWSGMRLLEVLPVFHRPACPRAHLLEHECPADTPQIPGALW